MTDGSSLAGMWSACFGIRANHGVIETFAIFAADVIFRKAHFCPEAAFVTSRLPQYTSFHLASSKTVSGRIEVGT
jgi:hypothetical protein